MFSGANSLHISHINNEDAMQTGIRLITGIAGGGVSGTLFGQFGGEGLTSFVGSNLSGILAGYIYGGTADGSADLFDGYTDRLYDEME